MISPRTKWSCFLSESFDQWTGGGSQVTGWSLNISPVSVWTRAKTRCGCESTQQHTVEGSKIHKIHSAKIKKKTFKTPKPLKPLQREHVHTSRMWATAGKIQEEEGDGNKTSSPQILHFWRAFFEEKLNWRGVCSRLWKTKFCCCFAKNKEVSLWKKKKQEARSFFSYCILLHEAHLKQFSAPGCVVVLTFASSFSFPPL